LNKAKAIPAETPKEAEERRRRDPFEKLRDKEGVVIKSTARRDP